MAERPRRDIDPSPENRCSGMADSVSLIYYSSKNDESTIYVCMNSYNVCSHQRLLFTLLGHSDDLDKDTMSDVSKDVLRILSEELASRSILYKQVC